MYINEIIENESVRKLLDGSIKKTFYKFNLSQFTELDDFTQDATLYLMDRLENFDENKASLNTYIPLVIMSCAKNIIQSHKAKYRKEFNDKSFSLDASYNNVQNDNMQLDEVIGAYNDESYVKALIDEILSMTSLSKNQKEIIRLMSKGYSKTDIAQILNKSTTCVNITFQRAKEKIVIKYGY